MEKRTRNIMIVVLLAVVLICIGVPLIYMFSPISNNLGSDVENATSQPQSDSVAALKKRIKSPLEIPQLVVKPEHSIKPSDPDATIEVTQAESRPDSDLKSQPQVNSLVDQPGSKARQLIALVRSQNDTPDLVKLYQQANLFKRTKQLTDAHLLYFFLAKLGHADSAIALATMYDPLYHSKATSMMLKPKPSQAYKWYTNAATTGHPQAQKRLQALWAWVVRTAGEGNTASQRLLWRWPQPASGE